MACTFRLGSGAGFGRFRYPAWHERERDASVHAPPYIHGKCFYLYAVDRMLNASDRQRRDRSPEPKLR